MPLPLASLPLHSWPSLMCRIAGIASLSFPPEEMQRSVGAMCQTLRHGGPDDEGIWVSEKFGLVLGHRRLSILDLSEAGHQPMLYDGDRYVITFNGEIYNYPELKRQLMTLGHCFQSSSDTEVVLAAFAAWGTESFARLNGMFAFALFDNETGHLYLVRDLMGIKPLYCALRQDTIIFASEVRAFAQAPFRFDDQPDWPVYLMAYGFLPEPITTLKEVEPLPKGSFLRYDTQSGKAVIQRYDCLRFFEKDTVRSSAKAEIRTLLEVAVHNHLLSDAPVGVFTSGGVDSSIITLLAGRQIGQHLNTLSLHFREEAYSEKAYQEMILAEVESVHHQEQLSEEAFHFNLPEVVEAMDLPSCDGINTWFISKMAKEAGLKAVLSGVGGDELFGGYPSFQRIGIASLLQAFPSAALRSGRYARTKKFRRLAYLSLDGAKGQYLFLRGLFTPRSIARFLDLDEHETWEILDAEPVLPDTRHLSDGNRASWMELNLYMQNQLLRDADVMSMAHGVEIRVPFLDKDFVKLTLSLAPADKYGGPFPKQVLIDAFRDILPSAIWQRKKMGFTFPFAEWLREDEWARSKLQSGGKSSIELLHQFDRGRFHWSGIMTALLLRTHNYETQPAFFNA